MNEFDTLGEFIRLLEVSNQKYPAQVMTGVHLQNLLKMLEAKRDRHIEKDEEDHRRCFNEAMEA